MSPATWWIIAAWLLVFVGFLALAFWPKEPPTPKTAPRWACCPLCCNDPCPARASRHTVPCTHQDAADAL